MKAYQGRPGLSCPMRALWLAVVLLVAPLTGCLTGADDDPPGNPPEVPPDRDGGSDDERPGESPSTDDGQGRSAPTPSLGPGLAWTYEASGIYSAGGEQTVVVARAATDGYLFAGGRPGDLAGEIHFDRPWLGQQTLELNPTGEDTEQLFDFPISDGKTWPSLTGTVTATQTALDTPLGEFEGFQMTLEGTEMDRTWTYAPGIGYLVSYTATMDGTTYLDLSLTDVQRADNATWYAPMGQVQLEGAPGQSGQLDVAGNASAVSIAAGASSGGQVTVLPPLTAQQEPFTFQTEGEQAWTYTQRAPAEGTWRVSTTQPPTSFAFASVAAVTWVELAPGYG